MLLRRDILKPESPAHPASILVPNQTLNFEDLRVAT